MVKRVISKKDLKICKFFTGFYKFYITQSDGKYKFITKYDVIKTIFDFLENKFELCDLELLIEFNEKNIKTIDSFYLRRIQDYEINVFIYLENKHIENFKQKIEKIIDVFQ